MKLYSSRFKCLNTNGRQEIIRITYIPVFSHTNKHSNILTTLSVRSGSQTYYLQKTENKISHPLLFKSMT